MPSLPDSSCTNHSEVWKDFGREKAKRFFPTSDDPCGKNGVWAVVSSVLELTGYTISICNALVHLRPRNVNEVVAVTCALNLPLEPQGRISVTVLMSMSLQRGLN